MFDWSDDDEILVAGLPSTKEPPHSAGVEDRSRGDKEIPEQQTREIPAQQTMEAPVVQMTGVPKKQGEVNLERHAETRSAAEEQEPSSQNTGVENTAVPGGLGRHRQFKKLNWQTKP